MNVSLINSFPRFWSKVDIRNPEDCWNWTAFRHRGYGKFRVAGKMEFAHRVAWEFFYHEPLGTRLACHKCDNPSCCNPLHIYAGTFKDNARDLKERGNRRPNGAKGEANHFAKLKETDVRFIKYLISDRTPISEIADYFKVDISTIRSIQKGRTWKDVPIDDFSDLEASE